LTSVLIVIDQMINFLFQNIPSDDWLCDVFYQNLLS